MRENISTTSEDILIFPYESKTRERTVFPIAEMIMKKFHECAIQ